MTLREQLQDVIDHMSDDEVAELLDRILMQSDPDELTPEELRDFEATIAEMEAGDYATLEEVKASLQR
ncbi:MAG: hypothetical protein ACSLFM_04645 [Tepidiformaceae bacterium]